MSTPGPRATLIRPRAALPALLATLLTAFLAIGMLPAPAHAEAWVERAQRRLNGLGCNAGPVDGDIGPRTRSAIVRFQSRHGLRQTARLNDATKSKLYSSTARPCNLRPVPARSGTGRRIVISQRQNWVWLVGRDGRVVAQSGMVDNPGELTVGRDQVGSYCGRSARIAKNTTSSGEVWLDNFVRFRACGFGFHRIPTSQASGAQIHPDWYAGTNFAQSHGCVRLPKRFSERLWDFGTVGTRVSVVRG